MNISQFRQERILACSSSLRDSMEKCQRALASKRTDEQKVEILLRHFGSIRAQIICLEDHLEKAAASISLGNKVESR